jgi:hypothetical protein
MVESPRRVGGPDQVAGAGSLGDGVSLPARSSPRLHEVGSPIERLKGRAAVHEGRLVVSVQALPASMGRSRSPLGPAGGIPTG